MWGEHDVKQEVCVNSVKSSKKEVTGEDGACTRGTDQKTLVREISIRWNEQRVDYKRFKKELEN